jgi:hypothetical protein
MNAYECVERMRRGSERMIFLFIFNLNKKMNYV